MEIILNKSTALSPFISEIELIQILISFLVRVLVFLTIDVSWEQRELGDVANVYDGIHQTPNYTNSGIMFLSVENIDTLKSEKYISEEAFNRDYKVYPEKGDVLMTRIGDVGTPNVLEIAEKVAFYVSLALLKPTNIDSYFLCNNILSPSFQRGLKERTLVTAIPQKINKDEIGKIDIILPISTDEQREIGLFFQHLNHLITLHQRKVDTLKSFKDVILQKMFPKGGSLFPEIRFSGFNEAWEQRKFSELFSERREKTIEENEDTLLSCAIEGIYLNTELFSHFRGSSNIGYLKVKKNDLILSAQNLHLGNANVNLRFEHGIISPAYKVYDLIQCDPLFAQAWVKKDKTKNFFLSATTEGASGCRKNVEWKTLEKQNIPVPNLIEQRVVGRYFEQLDHLITLHQRKLDNLKQMKSIMLERMFV